MKIIPITKNKKAIVDSQDFKYLSKFKWYAHKTPSGFYACRSLHKNGKVIQIKMHRIITNAPLNLSVDHINHNTLDNRRANLRLVTHKQNLRNRNGAIKNSYSGVRGVVFHKKSGKWQAQLGKNGKSIYLGLFSNLKMAKLTVQRARAYYFGKYCGV